MPGIRCDDDRSARKAGRAAALRAVKLYTVAGATQYNALDAARGLFAENIAHAYASELEPDPVEVWAYWTVKLWLADPSRNVEAAA